LWGDILQFKMAWVQALIPELSELALIGYSMFSLE
jgi:hypothetical protein